jgi:hypothetical protein
MLPVTVLRRLDLVLEPTKEGVLKEYERLKARGLKGNALHEELARYATKTRKQPLYNISTYTLKKLLDEKLKEYRTSLITSAVTCKIDLRNWQPTLPLLIK